MAQVQILDKQIANIQGEQIRLENTIIPSPEISIEEAKMIFKDEGVIPDKDV